MSDLLRFIDVDERDRAVDAITRALGETFTEDGKASPKRTEVKERFNKALAIVVEMRNELGWSWTRISDTLGSALRQRLDTGSWTPSSRNAWTLDAPSGLILPPGLK